MAYFIISEESRGFELLGFADDKAEAAALALRLADYPGEAGAVSERVRVLDGADLAALGRLAPCVESHCPKAAEALLDAFRPLYRVNSLDDSANGMERLRYQRESIIIAYPAADIRPADLAEQWRSDIASRDNGEANPDALASVCTLWAAVNAAELARLIGQASFDSGVRDDGEESAPFRLYVEESEAAAAIETGAQYTLELRLEAMACLWEAALESKSADWLAYREAQGTAAARHAIMALIDKMLALWDSLSEAERESLIPYDWEFVPAFLCDCVQWDSYGAEMRPDALAIMQAKAKESEA